MALTLRRGYLWFAAGLLIALLAGLLAFVYLQRAAQAPKATAEVAGVAALVARNDIAMHTLITAADVEVRQVPRELLAQDALARPEEAVGQLSTADIAAGETILARRLAAPDYVGPRAALVMDPDQVAVAFPAQDLLSSAEIYRAGDHVDVMFSLDLSKGNTGLAAGLQTATVLQDVRVAAIIRNGADSQQSASKGSVRAILLAVDPQDALMLKHLRDAGGVPDLALRSPAAEGEFDVQPVGAEYLANRYEVRWQATR